MSKNLQEKHFDIRVVNRYLKNGNITEKDLKEHYKSLPNDEDNFELVMIEEDDIGIGETLSEEELQSMPAITEDNIDNFDFMDEEKEEEKKKKPKEDNPEE